MKKLTLEHLSPYLPYKVLVGDGRTPFELTEHNFSNVFPYLTNIYLRPLSDLTKEIEHNGEKFVPMVELAKIANLDVTDYKLASIDMTFGIACNIENDDNNDKWEVLGFDTSNGFGCHYRPSKTWSIVMNQFELWNKLYSWHFDIFGLIEQGLAIDINTLEK